MNTIYIVTAHWAYAGQQICAIKATRGEAEKVQSAAESHSSEPDSVTVEEWVVGEERELSVENSELM